jgi:hypothetical protein
MRTGLGTNNSWICWSRNPLGSGLGVSSWSNNPFQEYSTGASRNPLGSGLGVSSEPIEGSIPYRVCESCGSQSPRFGSRCFVGWVNPNSRFWIYGSQSPRFGSRCFVALRIWRLGFGRVPAVRRNPLGSGLGVSWLGTVECPSGGVSGRNPLGSGLGVSSSYGGVVGNTPRCYRRVAIPSVRVSVFRPTLLGRRGGGRNAPCPSQSPRFGSRCFVFVTGGKSVLRVLTA